MNRLAIAAALLAGATAWIALLSLTTGGSEVSAAPPIAGLGAPAHIDKAVVKFVDLANFHRPDPATGERGGEVTLRMDVLDAAGKPINDLHRQNIWVLEGDLPGRVKSFQGPATQAVNVVLVIDISGSMRLGGRLSGAKEAARAALNALKVDRDRVGLIVFDDGFDVLQRFGPLTKQVKVSCEIAITSLQPRGSTSIGPPTVDALETFGREKSDGLKMVLVMTDGDDNNRQQFAQQRQRVGELSEKYGVQVHSISVGNEVSRGGASDLTDLAVKGKGRYEHAPQPDRLAELFRARVAETVNECSLVYDSPYPTPDGFDRKVTVTIATPGGKLNTTTEYKIGGVLTGRSRPAAWALAPETKGLAAALPKSSGAVQVPLFVGLFLLLTGGLVVPEFRRRRGGGSETPPQDVSVTPVPVAVRPPPPPPGRPAIASPAARSAAPIPPAAAPARPAPPPPKPALPPAAPRLAAPPAAGPAPRPAGGVIKPPPPPPPRK